jgi:hypothetical protein
LWFVGIIMVSSGEGHFATTFSKVKGFSGYIAIGWVARAEAFRLDTCVLVRVSTLYMTACCCTCIRVCIRIRKVPVGDVAGDIASTGCMIYIYNKRILLLMTAGTGAISQASTMSLHTPVMRGTNVGVTLSIPAVWVLFLLITGLIALRDRSKCRIS